MYKAEARTVAKVITGPFFKGDVPVIYSEQQHPQVAYGPGIYLSIQRYGREHCVRISDHRDPDHYRAFMQLWNVCKTHEAIGRIQKAIDTGDPLGRYSL